MVLISNIEQILVPGEVSRHLVQCPLKSCPANLIHSVVGEEGIEDVFCRLRSRADILFQIYLYGFGGCLPTLFPLIEELRSVFVRACHDVGFEQGFLDLPMRFDLGRVGHQISLRLEYFSAFLKDIWIGEKVSLVGGGGPLLKILISVQLLLVGVPLKSRQPNVGLAIVQLSLADIDTKIL